METQTPVLVLFDLVSTITDAGPRYAQAYADMAVKYGLPVPDTEDIMQDLGNKNLKEIIERHSPGLAAEKIKSFMGDCNNACDSLLYDVHWIESLFDHVRETLLTLKGQGYVLGLYTGTREDAMQSQLRYHNLTQYFDPQLLRGKNNERDGYIGTQELKMAQLKSLIADFQKRHGEDARVIIVGDSISDYHAARECRTVFVGFAENWKKTIDMKDAGVGTTFSDYRDLPNIISVLSSKASPQTAVSHSFNAKLQQG